jgi:hypothetical protein
MKGNLTLVLFRMMSITTSVVINIFIIKLLSLDEVGKYYIIGTIAYFGNALFFVGFDFSLQRKIRNISIAKSIDFSSLRSYLFKTLPYGVLASFALSSVIYFAGNTHNWFEIAVLCAALAAINFLNSLSRNILQIADEKYRVSNSLLLEQLAKLCLCFTMSFFGGASAIVITMAFMLASLVCIIFNYHQIARCLHPVNGTVSYAIDSNDISKIVLPVGAGGVLNWLQLQSYRPVLGQLFQKAELVGTVSFLTMLGATVTSASLGVLAQVWIPKQFATNGDASRRLVKLACFATFTLALIAYPAAYIFLRFLKKDSLYGLEYLVSMGVIMEGGNFILGVLGNHTSLTLKSFVPSMLAGVVGFVAAVTIVFIVSAYQWIGPGTIGLALATSQCVAVAALLPVLLRKFSQQTNS